MRKTTPEMNFAANKYFLWSHNLTLFMPSCYSSSCALLNKMLPYLFPFSHYHVLRWSRVMYLILLGLWYWFLCPHVFQGDPLPAALVELVRNSPISSIEDLQLLLLTDSVGKDQRILILLFIHMGVTMNPNTVTLCLHSYFNHNNILNIHITVFNFITKCNQLNLP